MQLTLTAIDFRASGSAMNLPIPLFTGDKSVEFDTGYGTEGLVYIQQPQALPMTISWVFIQDWRQKVSKVNFIPFENEARKIYFRSAIKF